MKRRYLIASVLVLGCAITISPLSCKADVMETICAKGETRNAYEVNLQESERSEVDCLARSDEKIRSRRNTVIPRESDINIDLDAVGGTATGNAHVAGLHRTLLARCEALLVEVLPELAIGHQKNQILAKTASQAKGPSGWNDPDDFAGAPFLAGPLVFGDIDSTTDFSEAAFPVGQIPAPAPEPSSVLMLITVIAGCTFKVGKCGLLALRSRCRGSKPKPRKFLKSLWFNKLIKYGIG